MSRARSPERLRELFHRFARVEAMELASPLYAELAYAVSESPELLALAAHARPGQPPPNMLFGAVQYLLLRGAAHPLAAHYPIVSGETRPMTPAAGDFLDFCRVHAADVAELLHTRLTQTNVVRRCTCLVPAFSIVAAEAGRPLHLVDLGASAGLNLNFDRYGVRYTRAGREVLRWGDAAAVVQLEAELRGDGLPRLEPDIAVGDRVGVDLDPVDALDPDALLWLRALIWPEHLERHQRLVDAAEELRAHPVRLLGGDAAEALPGLLSDAPGGRSPDRVHDGGPLPVPACGARTRGGGPDRRQPGPPHLAGGARRRGRDGTHPDPLPRRLGGAHGTAGNDFSARLVARVGGLLNP